jgi:hypothetical protein
MRCARSASEPRRASRVERRAPAPRDLTPAGVLRLQRTAGNRATVAAIARVPYQTTYSETTARRILNESEGRNSPVTNAEGHPRQHVGRWEKAEHYAEEQSKTKSVFTNTQQQDKAVADVLASVAGQAALAVLDQQPNVAARQVINAVDTDATEVKVVKAKKKKGTLVQGPLPPGQVTRPGAVKDWEYTSGTATKASVIVESRGTGQLGDIHIQTAYPVLD